MMQLTVPGHLSSRSERAIERLGWKVRLMRIEIVQESKERPAWILVQPRKHTAVQIRRGHAIEVLIVCEQPTHAEVIRDHAKKGGVHDLLAKRSRIVLEVFEPTTQSRAAAAIV